MFLFGRTPAVSGVCILFFDLNKNTYCKLYNILSFACAFDDAKYAMTSRFYWDPVSRLTLVGSASVSIVTGTAEQPSIKQGRTGTKVLGY